ncbi:keratinocyte proline-rich protein [Heterocephalus glaber]|uniref:Keratinocyte proline-rich protein n=1 Tax=Heterocephalus glaber TaxID=10181 RepID=A0AAX6QAG9_HETGA|nr:keratinocyte proline-rich protein [Heterocephalus glaber]
MCDQQQIHYCVPLPQCCVKGSSVGPAQFAGVNGEVAVPAPCGVQILEYPAPCQVQVSQTPCQSMTTQMECQAPCKSKTTQVKFQAPSKSKTTQVKCEAPCQSKTTQADQPGHQAHLEYFSGRPLEVLVSTPVPTLSSAA